MSFNIENFKEISSYLDDFNNDDNNKSNDKKSIPCIWDADGDGNFSSGDVTAYINKNYNNLNNTQINNIIETLQNDFAKKVKYNQINIALYTQKVIATIKNVISQKPTNTSNIINSALNFVKNREKNTKRILLFAQLKGYKSNLSIKNQQIKNQYYTGGSYNVQYLGLNVTVTNNQTGKKHTLDLYSLLDNMNDNEIVDFLLFIQKQPAEVLEDLAVEMDDILSPTGRDMHTMDNREFVAGGYYKPSNDSIVTSPVHLVHELGHAVDYSGKINKASTTKNKKYMASFRKELDKYKKMGGVQYDYNNKQTWKRGEEYNYCTANGQELFAESYKLAMTGNCRSKNVITKYFPETFKIALEIINETRQKTDLERRYTPQREMNENIVNALKK